MLRDQCEQEESRYAVEKEQWKSSKDKKGFYFKRKGINYIYIYFFFFFSSFARY